MTMTTDQTWQTDEIRDLFEAILELRSVDESAAFFRDLCTLGELHDMAQRWAVVRMLEDGLHYAEISKRTGASTATITRIAAWLHHGEGGYRAALDRRAARIASGSTPYPTRPER
jgi:TrpR-related protein YerC/YecD